MNFLHGILFISTVIIRSHPNIRGLVRILRVGRLLIKIDISVVGIEFAARYYYLLPTKQTTAKRRNISARTATNEIPKQKQKQKITGMRNIFA